MPDDRQRKQSPSTPQYRVWGEDEDGDYDVLEERRTCPTAEELTHYLADYTTVSVIAREAFPVFELSRETDQPDEPE